MGLITLLLLGLGLLGGATVLSVVLLTLTEIYDWFRVHTTLIKADKDHCAITIKQSLESGQYRVVQGVLNRRTQTLAAQRIIDANELDTELQRMHRHHQTVYHTI